MTDEIEQALERLLSKGPITAEEAMARMDATIESGESSMGFVELEGKEALKFAQLLFSKGGEDVPPELMSFFESGVVSGASVKMVKEPIENSEGDWLDVQHTIPPTGRVTTLREVRAMAQQQLDDPTSTGDEEGMANLILYMVERLGKAQDLLDQAEKLIRQHVNEHEQALKIIEAHAADEHDYQED